MWFEHEYVLKLRQLGNARNLRRQNGSIKLHKHCSATQLRHHLHISERMHFTIEIATIMKTERLPWFPKDSHYSTKNSLLETIEQLTQTPNCV